MLFIYGSYMPLRWLEEIRFWKTQEKEHTVVIREIVPGLEPAYVQTLKDWEPVFASTERCADIWLTAFACNPEQLPLNAPLQVNALLHASRHQSEAFVRQLAYIRDHSAAVQKNPLAPVVINHIIRESEYFLCVLNTLEDSRSADKQSEAAEQEQAPDRLPSDEQVKSSLYFEDGDDSRAQERPVPIGGHTLPPLPYAYNALEPYIDEETMRIHHDKHHLSYVEGLNKAEKELEKSRKTGNFDLVKHWERELAFNGAGHYLHTIFWNVMTPGGGGTPSGAIADAIKKDFGSFDAFKKQFSEAANKVEGGGWAILVWSPRSHRLEILQAEKHQNLSQWDVVPILPLDVWEHAYYLKHQNKRADYIKDWWNVVNWPYANARYLEASQLKWEPY